MKEEKGKEIKESVTVLKGMRNMKLIFIITIMKNEGVMKDIDIHIIDTVTHVIDMGIDIPFIVVTGDGTNGKGIITDTMTDINMVNTIVIEINASCLNSAKKMFASHFQSEIKAA